MATLAEESKEYIKKVKGVIEDMPDTEKIPYLLEKIRYWHWSAIDWREDRSKRMEEVNE